MRKVLSAVALVALLGACDSGNRYEGPGGDSATVKVKELELPFYGDTVRCIWVTDESRGTYGGLWCER
jgi:hypothetical protein